MICYFDYKNLLRWLCHDLNSNQLGLLDNLDHQLGRQRAIKGWSLRDSIEAQNFPFSAFFFPFLLGQIGFLSIQGQTQRSKVTSFKLYYERLIN